MLDKYNIRCACPFSTQSSYIYTVTSISCNQRPWGTHHHNHTSWHTASGTYLCPINTVPCIAWLVHMPDNLISYDWQCNPCTHCHRPDKPKLASLLSVTLWEMSQTPSASSSASPFLSHDTASYMYTCLYMDTGQSDINCSSWKTYLMTNIMVMGFTFIYCLIDCYSISCASSGELALHWYAQYLIF